MYPKVCDDYIKFREEFGPVALLDTRIFLTGPKVGEEFEVVLEKGKTLHIKTLAVSEIRSKTGEREVFFELNGQLRTVLVKDKTVKQVNFVFFNFFFEKNLITVVFSFFRFDRKLYRIQKH